MCLLFEVYLICFVLLCPGAWLPLPGIKQSAYRTELLAAVRALEECQPQKIVSDCKGVFKAVQALQTGRRHLTGQNQDLEKRMGWMKAHQTQNAALLWIVARLPPLIIMAMVKPMSWLTKELLLMARWIRMLPGPVRPTLDARGCATSGQIQQRASGQSTGPAPLKTL
eukprot:80896-Amphidinium_carterae.1